MLAVYLASASPVTDWIGIVIVLATIALVGAFGEDRTRKVLLVWLVIVGVGMATLAYAGPYGPVCDPLWRWLGLC